MARSPRALQAWVVCSDSDRIHRPAPYGGKMRKLNALLLLCLALLFGSNVQAQTGSGVNNAELSGNYAFTFSGFTGNSGGSSVFATVGRVTADGSGTISGGEPDTHRVRPRARGAPR